MPALLRCVAICCILAATSAWAVPFYRVQAIAPANSNAYGINSDGDIAGVYQTSGGANHAFLFSQSSGFLDLGTLNGGSSIGRAISDLKEVGGQSDGRAFRYSQANGMVALSTQTSDARGMDNQGFILGTIYNPTTATTTLWDPFNNPTSLFVSENTEGYGVIGSGGRIGRTDEGQLGYFSDGSSNTSFDSLGFFLPNDINDGSNLAGSENGVASARILGNFISLGLLNPTDSVSDALSIDNLNHIVGYSGLEGFLWTELDGMKSINSLLAPGYQQWSVLSANGINDNGWITGQGQYNGDLRAVYLVPIALGDMNDDGSLDNFDIQPFEMALTDTAGYLGTYDVNDYQQRGDINGDGAFDNFDIQPFENLLTSGPSTAVAAVPEPSTRVFLASTLLVLAGFACSCRARSWFGVPKISQSGYGKSVITK